MIQHTFGLLVQPSSQWKKITELSDSSFKTLLLYPWLMAIIPAVAWYFGTTNVGWTVGGGEVVRLTKESALQICILFYLTQIVCLSLLGYFVHWMSDTYGAESTISKGIILMSLAATPLFISGAVGFYPILWLDLLIGIVAVCWAVYLLYLGLPIAMDIPEERGFLFASAVLGVALVLLICIMVGAVIIWDFGAAPVYID